jgi:hypothetical protein
MDAPEARPKTALGFLTVVDHPQYGLFGGYLLLSTAGRPLEFHCTAPIKPNRAQQILYGPTLESFLYGEQIGQTLLEKAKIEPSLVCTDREPMLAVCEHVRLPVVLVLTADSPAPDRDGKSLRLDPDRLAVGNLRVFQVGRNRLAVPEQLDGVCRRMTERLGRLVESFDLLEPFTRIREAIEEAQRVVRLPTVRAA